MADFYATARSNYFAVKDEAAFRAAVAELDPDLEIVTKDDRFALLCRTDHGTWPTNVYGEATDDYIDVDVPALVAGHLVEGEVAVFMEAGAMKIAYVDGAAEAINANGDRARVELGMIYDLARKLGPNVTEAEG